MSACSIGVVLAISMMIVGWFVEPVLHRESSMFLPHVLPLMRQVYFGALSSHGIARNVEWPLDGHLVNLNDLWMLEGFRLILFEGFLAVEVNGKLDHLATSLIAEQELVKQSHLLSWLLHQSVVVVLTERFPRFAKVTASRTHFVRWGSS